MKPQLNFLCILFLINTLGAQETAPPRVEIPGTQIQKITSSIVEGQEYNLYINLPRGYEDTTKRFPVVYLLDAQWDFTLVYSLHGEQYYDGFIPGLITVGITWGGTNPKPDSLRARDFSPTHVPYMVQSGGAPKFLSFIKNELIPFIDSKYRTKADRTLIGSSFGGLFTLFALFNETETFHRYILTSPYIAYDNDVIYSSEKSYAAKNRSLPVKLYMAHGELEGGVPQFQKLVKQIKSRKYKGLDMQTRILEHTGHSGGKAEGYTRGLQFIFARPSIKVAGKVLDHYTGSYEMGGGELVKVIKKNGVLVAQLPYREPAVLQAESETDFYHEGSYLNVHFEKDEAGTVIGAQLDLYGGESFVKKVK